MKRWTVVICNEKWLSVIHMADERGQVFWMNVDYQLWDPLSPVLRLFETKGWRTFNHEVVSWVLFLSFCVQLFNNTSSWLVVWRTIVTIFVKQLINNQSLSKALVSSIVFTKKNKTLKFEGRKNHISSLRISCHFQEGPSQWLMTHSFGSWESVFNPLEFILHILK